MEEKNRKIINTAIEIFSEKGFNKTTMQEIAEEAGVGKGTIYRFFNSKEDMVSSLLEISIDEISEQISSAISPLDDPLEKMKAIIKVELDYYYANRNLARFLVREMWGYQSKFLDHIRKIRESRATTIEQIIEEGMQKNQFKTLDPQTITASLEGMILASTIYWFTFHDEYPKKQIEENINRLFFQGILA